MSSEEDELSGLRARVAELEQALAETRPDAASARDTKLNAMYRAALASAPMGLGVTDDAGDFLIWNNAMLAVSGFAPSDEARWHEVRATPAAREQRLRMMGVAIQRGGLPPTDVRIPRQGGGITDAVATVNPCYLDDERYWHVTLQDVTELKRVENALRESELRFRQVAETVRQVFYITSADHSEIIYISPAYEELWGRSRQSLHEAPRSWLEAIHPEDQPRIIEALSRPPVDHQYSFEFRIIRPDGSVRWISDRAFELLDAEGKVYRVVGVADDITERRRFEEQLRESQKMEAVGQLAGGVAHDFNNLLTAIVGNVSLLLRRTDESAAHRDQLQEVQIAAQRAAELTRKLLGFSRRALLSLEPVDLRTIARETIALLRRTVDPRVRLLLEESADPCTVLADAGEMSQVLLNLCLNSRDAMPEGGKLMLRTHACQVSEAHARHVMDARVGPAVCLTVEDTGHGIAPDILQRVFEPFFTTKQPGAGTGLGLAMVFGIVKQHQGWIELSSEEGTGTRFDIYLPLHSDARMHDQVLASVPPEARRRETILFVDDEEALRKLACSILSDRGYQVIVAEDGEAALSLFEREHGRIDLVILDLRMPRLSGRDTLHGLWRIRPDTRVLVSSGHAQDHERVAASEPIAGSLPKPYGFDELARAVREALDQRPAVQV